MSGRDPRVDPRVGDRWHHATFAGGAVATITAVKADGKRGAIRVAVRWEADDRRYVEPRGRGRYTLAFLSDPQFTWAPRGNELAERYAAWVASMRAAGIRLIAYKPPCGCPALETNLPPKGQVWDSLVTCPGCAALHMKITRHNHVEVHVFPPNPGAGA